MNLDHMAKTDLHLLYKNRSKKNAYHKRCKKKGYFLIEKTVNRLKEKNDDDFYNKSCKAHNNEGREVEGWFLCSFQPQNKKDGHEED